MLDDGILIVALPTGVVERLEIEASKQWADCQGVRAFFGALP